MLANRFVYIDQYDFKNANLTPIQKLIHNNDYYRYLKISSIS